MPAILNGGNMIKTENIVFIYDNDPEEGVANNRAALNCVNIEIKRGEFLVVLGHNGSGKSTLAKHFNALLTPTEGVVWVKGLDTKNENNTWEIRKTAGMVFQNPDHQFVATIVRDDVAFGPENLGVEQSEIVERVENALSTVGMLEYSNTPPSRLSGGQKQRVAIAGILAMKTDCIILDESTSMLDPSGRKEVLDTIIRLKNELGITVILITHYMDEAAKADRVIVMDKGTPVMDGTPKEVFRHIDKLKSIGLDVPQIAETAHLLRKKGLNLPYGILTIDEMLTALAAISK